MPYQRSSVHSNGYSTDGQQSRSVDGEAPTYVIEHLATFTVSKEAGVVYPEDGMRRLLQLEKSNGIWSQKMQLRLDQNWVLIMDYETGSIMERFPAVLIQEPTAFTSHNPMEIYNNILVFIVGEQQSGARSEMHIFQCQFVSAQELAEDLKLLRSGKAPVNQRSRHIPPPPPTPPPEPPLNGVKVREQVSVFNAAAHHEPRGGGPGGGGPGGPDVGRRELYAGPVGPGGPVGSSGPAPRDAASISLNDETSSTSSEKYERDVTILNHCFDDIEKFIARLQHAAAASRELERRKRNRKSKKKDMGDGMLSMRAKPPPEGEFVDIFQKFKLSFNLLAKLKAHIHDPNAPELVHFLFTPLALIVDASHDTPYGPNLPAKVVSPLLTREAVNLLINCVTSKETELWHSLGDAWLVPRDQWKGYVAPYHPVFMDGWSPEFPLIDEREQGPEGGKRHRNEEIRAAQQDADYGSDYFDYELQEGEQARFSYETRNFVTREPRYRDEREHSQSPVSSDRDYPSGPPLPLRDVTARSDISADSIERNGGPGGPMGGGPMGSGPMGGGPMGGGPMGGGPMGGGPMGGGPMGGGPMGPGGPIPSASGSENQQRFERVQGRWLQDLKSKGAKVVQVTYPRTANNDKELTVIRGEYLEILDDSRKWWKARNVCGQVAHVPHTIVTAPTADSSDVFSNPLYVRNYDRMENPRERDSGSPPLSSPAPAHPPAHLPAHPPAHPPADWVKERQGKKAFRGIPPPDSSTTPPAPPPMPSPTPSQIRSPTRPPLRNVFSTQSSVGSISLAESTVLEELESVLKGATKPLRSLEIHRTPEVYIDHQSDAKAVQEWLKMKGFSEGLCKKLQGTTGAQVLQLSRSDLLRTIGPEEDWRLYSQLTLQRNAATKFKTARTAELQNVLQKFRQKVDEEDAETNGNNSAITSESSPNKEESAKNK